MGLMEQIKADIYQIVTNSNDFGVTLTFVAPTAETITVVGTAKKHRIQYDEYGVPKTGTNTKNVSCSVAVDSLTGYPYRNGEGEIDLAGHLVTWTDAMTVPIQYQVSEWYPDETVGLIVIILGEYGI